MTDGLFFLTLAPAGEVVGGAVGQVLDGLHRVLAKSNEHRCVEARQCHKLIGNPERLALGVELGFEFLQMLPATRLNLRGRVLVETFDRRNLSRLDEGHFLDRGEALRCEQLGDHFVDVEGFHEQRRALGELRLAALRLRCLCHDVDVPAGELGGEPHILAFSSDGQR